MMRYLILVFLTLFSGYANSRDFPPTVSGWYHNQSRNGYPTLSQCQSSVIPDCNYRHTDSKDGYCELVSFGQVDTYRYSYVMTIYRSGPSGSDPPYTNGAECAASLICPDNSAPLEFTNLSTGLKDYYCRNSQPACPAGQKAVEGGECKPICDADKELKSDGTCGCPEGTLLYSDGRCDPPPDCQKAKGSTIADMVIGAVSKKNTACYDYCRVSSCQLNVPEGGGVSVELPSFTCEYSGESCDVAISDGKTWDAEEEGQNQPGGGSDTGGTGGNTGDTGGTPGTGDTGGGDNPGTGTGTGEEKPGTGEQSGGDTGEQGGTPGGTGNGSGSGTGGSGTKPGDKPGEDEEEKSCPSWLKWICGDTPVEDVEVPSSDQFSDSFFNGTFDSLQGFSLPIQQGSCAPLHFSVMGSEFSTSLHCDMMAETFPVFQTVMSCIWVLIAFRIVMGA